MNRHLHPAALLGRLSLAVFTPVACGGDGAAKLLTLDGNQPLVVGHRGASGYLPEETLEAYQLGVCAAEPGSS